MKSLFLHRNEPVTFTNAFSDGSYVACRFINGWPCATCGCLTEHVLVDGCQVCSICDTSKGPILPTSQFLEYKSFLSSVKFYSDKIEFEAISKALGFSEFDESGVSDWVQVRGQLRSNKILEEVIKNAKF